MFVTVVVIVLNRLAQISIIDTMGCPDGEST